MKPPFRPLFALYSQTIGRFFLTVLLSLLRHCARFGRVFRKNLTHLESPQLINFG